MIIPVSHADMARISEVAQALEGCWNRFGADRVFYHDAMSQMLGYQGQADMEANCVTDVTVSETELHTFEDIKETLVWNSFRSGIMSYSEATTVVGLLNLGALDFFTKIKEIQNSKLPFKISSLMFDEYSLYGMSPRWLESTPELIEAGAPPYSLAIFPDGQAFRWDKLRDMALKLPDNLDQQIADVRAYDGLDEKSKRLRFYREELILPSYDSAIEVIAQEDKIPPGFEFICHDGYEYLFNYSIGGYIPVAFNAESGSLYEAILMLLRGDEVRFDSSRLQPPDDDGFQREVFDGVRKVQSNASEHRKMRNRQNLHSECGLASCGDQTFVFGNQIYLRRQRWVEPGDVPPRLAAKSSLKCLPGLDTLNEVLPASYLKFHQELKAELSDTLNNAASYVTEAFRDGSLIRHVTAYLDFSVADLDSLCHKEMLQWVLEDFDDRDDRDAEAALLQSYRTHQKQYHEEGLKILQAIPELRKLEPECLAWLHRKSISQTSQSFSPVSTFVNDDSSCAYLLSYIILRANAFALNLSFDYKYGSLEKNEVYYSISVLLEAVDKSKSNIPLDVDEQSVLESMNAMSTFQHLKRFKDSLVSCDRFIDKAQSWQADYEGRREIREKGIYLHIEGQVKAKESAWSEIMAMGRSTNFKVSTQIQSFAELQSDQATGAESTGKDVLRLIHDASASAK